MRDVLRIGIAGLGTVGCAVVATLQENQVCLDKKSQQCLKIVAVSARDQQKQRPIDMSDLTWFDDSVAMAQHADIDIFVELIGGEDGVAYQAVKAALTRGCAVVTANKALLAKHGFELACLAEEKQTFLRFEAAVAGGIPIIKLMRESFVSNNVSRLYGIMNGTCNYILTQMEKEKISFQQALAEAQALGYAEMDPTCDIDGADTANKLALLTCLAFHTQPNIEKMQVEGISHITLADVQAASEMGYRIKLLGVAVQTDSGIEQRVHPTMVPETSTIAQINGVTNAVSVHGDLFGDILISGAGAGGSATASSVIADLMMLANCQDQATGYPVFTVPAPCLKPLKQAAMQMHEDGFFVRLRVKDRAGVLVALLAKMAENEISLKSLVQKADSEGDISVKTVTIITYGATEFAVRQALEKMMQDGLLVSKPQMIRIEHPS